MEQQVKDLSLSRLWHRLQQAVAWVQALAQELPHTADAK